MFSITGRWQKPVICSRRTGKSKKKTEAPVLPEDIPHADAVLIMHCKKEPVPGSGTGSGFMIDGLPAEVEKAKGIQNRHEDSTENIEDRVEHSCFPPFL